MARPSAHGYFLSTAKSVSERSTCPRLSVGCVLVREEVIFATGYNGKARGEPHCDHRLDEPCPDSVHAEANAIASAARLGVATSGSHAYVTHAPCLSCARLLINAGIVRVSFDLAYRDSAGLDLLMNRGMVI